MQTIQRMINVLPFAAILFTFVHACDKKEEPKPAAQAPAPTVTAQAPQSPPAPAPEAAAPEVDPRESGVQRGRDAR